MKALISENLTHGVDVLQQLAQKLAKRKDLVGKQAACQQDPAGIGKQIDCLLLHNKNSYGKIVLRADTLAQENLNGLSVTSPALSRCRRLLREYEELGGKLCEMDSPLEKQQLAECLMFISYDLMPLVQRISARFEEEIGEPCSTLEELMKLQAMVEQRKTDIDLNGFEADKSAKGDRNGNESKSIAILKFKYALIGAVCGTLGIAWSQAEHHSQVQVQKSATETRRFSLPAAASQSDADKIGRGVDLQRSELKLRSR